MPFLTLARRGAVVFRYPLTKEEITIGRAPSCDLQLDDPTLSRIHCELHWDGAYYRLTDRSRNGLRLNNTALTGARVLAPGDQLILGEWTLEYHTEPAAVAADTVTADPQPTLILQYDPAKKTLTVETIELTLTGAAGIVERVTVHRIPATFGGAPGNDIVIRDDPYVSRTHCVIEEGPAGLMLRDAESRNGTWWQGVRMTNQVLPPTGEFLVGKTTIGYRLVETTETIRPSPRRRCGEMLGRSQVMQELFGLIERVAASEAPALIMGESGTGKELCARALHAASHRANKAFIALNCGAIPPNIIESELFGHERGAFTGATSQHRGVFEQTRGGTLFLDEIGEMPPELQTRLLRVLEARTVRRVGGTAEIPVDFRLAAATHQDLRQRIAKGQFREDLYYRLYVIPIALPPLRERGEDLDLLIDHYCGVFGAKGKKATCTPAAREALKRYRWPGNVRELRNTLQRALLLAGTSAIEPQHLIFAPAREEDVAGLLSLDARERDAIVAALAAAKGNCSRAARHLGIARTTLATKIKKYRIVVESL